MSQVYTEEKIGRTRSMTPEGFLLCEDVPIARCGDLYYAEGEVPAEADNGIIRVTRSPDDVFKPKSIASFAGKPVIITHEGGRITPETWKEYAVGIVLNPRREDDMLVADLLITDAKAIELVQNTTQHEVSAGYDAEYESLGPGKARQHDIIGNHVALVERGRCGPRCAIGDSEMTIKRKQLTKDAAARMRLRNAFLTGDAEAFEKVMDDVVPASLGENVPEDMTGKGDAGEQGHHIIVNINGATGAVEPNDSQTAEGAGFTDTTKDEVPAAGGDAPAWAQEMMAQLAAVGHRLDALEAAVSGEDQGDPEDQPLGEAPPEDEAGEDMPDDDNDEEEPTKDSSDEDEDKKMTMDAKTLRAEHAETIARAEVLVPGMRMMTLDAASSIRDNAKKLCGFRRQVLMRAARADDKDRANAVGVVLGGRDLRAMTCDAVGMAFNAASEIVKRHNTKSTLSLIKPHAFAKDAPKGPMTPAQINDLNRKLHGITG